METQREHANTFGPTGSFPHASPRSKNDAERLKITDFTVSSIWHMGSEVNKTRYEQVGKVITP